MKNPKLTKCIRILLCILIYQGYGQHDVGEHLLLTTYDQTIGTENTELYSGIAYTQSYSMQENNHTFFKSYTPLEGTITYNDQLYYGQKIKYDLLEDHVIVTLRNGLNRDNVLIINNNNISSMNIDGHIFARTDRYMPVTGPRRINSFLEVLLKSEKFTFLKSHKKTVRETIKNNRVLHDFDKKITYFLHKDDTLYTVRSRKNILNLFRSYKDELKAIKKGKNLLSEDEELFLYMLKRVELLQSQNKKMEVHQL